MASPKIKPSRKGAPPTVDAPTSPVVGNNTSKPDASDTVPLNFRVPPEFKRELKSFAAEHDMSMVEVIKEAWQTYKAIKGKG